MAENREQEFAALRKSATERLERPEVDLPHHQLRLRLWHYPSFAYWSSWLLYCPLPRYDDIESLIVVRSVWDQMFDAQRFRDPMKGLTYGYSIHPSISLNRSQLSRDRVEPRLSALREITVPVLFDDAVGVDGESFGLEILGFRSSVRLTWWCEPSREWSALSAWCSEFRCLLEENCTRLERERQLGGSKS
jgi:hypothetical protein